MFVVIGVHNVNWITTGWCSAKWELFLWRWNVWQDERWIVATAVQCFVCVYHVCLALSWCTVYVCPSRWATTFHWRLSGDRSSALLLLRSCYDLLTRLATTIWWCSILSTTTRGISLNLHRSFCSACSGSVSPPLVTEVVLYCRFMWSAVCNCFCHCVKPVYSLKELIELMCCCCAANLIYVYIFFATSMLCF